MRYIRRLTIGKCLKHTERSTQLPFSAVIEANCSQNCLIAQRTKVFFLCNTLCN